AVARGDVRSFPTRRSSDLGLPFRSIPGGISVIEIPPDLLQQSLEAPRRWIDGSGVHVPRLVVCEQGVGLAVVEELDVDLSSSPRSEEHTSELQSLAYVVCR